MKNLSITFENSTYRFNGFWGWLTKRKASVQKAVVLTARQEKAYKGVCEPYTLAHRQPINAPLAVPPWHHTYAKVLVWAAQHCFPLLRVLLLLRLNTYANAGEAAEAFRSLIPDRHIQRTLCLSRAVYIATTSQRFRRHGALFIGVHLPFVRMHAWVIEDNMQADYRDFDWISYQPVAVY